MFQRKIPPDMLGLLLSWEPAFSCINWLSSRVTRFHGGQERSRQITSYQNRTSLRASDRPAITSRTWSCSKVAPPRNAATLAGRDAMQELVNAAKRNPRPFDVLLTDDTSRLARNTEDALRIESILRFNGVCWNGIERLSQLRRKRWFLPRSYKFSGILQEGFWR